MEMFCYQCEQTAKGKGCDIAERQRPALKPQLPPRRARSVPLAAPRGSVWTELPNVG